MPSRTACRISTVAGLAAAGESALRLLERGPDAVTVAAVSKEIGRSADWIYLYIGKRDALLEHCVRSFADKAIQDLQRVASTETAGKVRIRLMIAALVPLGFHHMSPLWALWLAGGMPDLAGRLALAIADVLGAELPHYTVPIGWGVLGILRGCVSPVWADSTRDDVVGLVTGMTCAVEFYDQWETLHMDDLAPKARNARGRKIP